jgi:glycosylphosphatidylinositol transamidase (GPIT) subunit GPI8
LGGKGRQISEFKASLIYRMSSRTARATQRNPVLKNKNKQKQKQKQKSIKQIKKNPNNNNNNKQTQNQKTCIHSMCTCDKAWLIGFSSWFVFV